MPLEEPGPLSVAVLDVPSLRVCTLAPQHLNTCPSLLEALRTIVGLGGLQDGPG